MEKPYRVQAPLLKQKPSELIRNGQIWTTCEVEEKALPHVLKQFNPKCLMWPSDYPHERLPDMFSATYPEFLERDDYQRRNQESDSARQPDRFLPAEDLTKTNLEIRNSTRIQMIAKKAKLQTLVIRTEVLKSFRDRDLFACQVCLSRPRFSDFEYLNSGRHTMRFKRQSSDCHRRRRRHRQSLRPRPGQRRSQGRRRRYSRSRSEESRRRHQSGRRRALSPWPST